MLLAQRVCWPSSGHSLAAVMIPPGPALADLYWQQPIRDNIFWPLNIPVHTYIAHLPLLSWCLLTLLEDHFTTFAMKLKTPSKSLIPWLSTVPDDPTPQCPPTYIYKNRTIFSWIPLCAWHLLFLPHILCTKGCTYTCLHAHTWINWTLRLNTHT